MKKSVGIMSGNFPAHFSFLFVTHKGYFFLSLACFAHICTRQSCFFLLPHLTIVVVSPNCLYLHLVRSLSSSPSPFPYLKSSTPTFSSLARTEKGQCLYSSPFTKLCNQTLSPPCNSAIVRSKFNQS